MIYAEKEHDIPEMRWAYDPGTTDPRRLLMVRTSRGARFTAYSLN